MSRRHIGIRARWLAACFFATALPASGIAQGRAARPIIERPDQLPQRVYFAPQSASGFLESSSEWLALSESLRRDLASDLSAYEFRDIGLRLQYIWRLFVLHLVANQLDSATVRLNELRAVRAAAGLPPSSAATDLALLTARRTSRSEAPSAVLKALRQQVADLTPAEIHRSFSSTRLNLMTEVDSARIRESVTRVLRRAVGGRLAGRDALALIPDWWNREELAILPHLVDGVTQLLRDNPRLQVDIWPARSFSLDTAKSLTPVAIAVWDAGVDTSVLAGRVHRNALEVPGNGVDDDGNGFVDDVHGAGFASGRRTTTLMESAPFSSARFDSIAMWTRGQRDIRHVVDSPDAQALVHLFHTLTSAALREFRSSVVQLVVYYGHGTQIASLAIDGNPAARVLALIQREWRQTNDSTFVTVEGAQSTARTYRESVAYMRQQGVRVVNASWGMALRDFESETRRLMPNATPEEQRQRAREVMTIHADALVAALSSAPDILFVFTAGNERLDIRQTGRIPASLDLPNLITVGGADLDGDEATFTSFGKIDVYANAVERRAQFPGGQTGVVSAGSLAAPDVVNLASKLWAVYPRATVAEVRSAIIDGADERTAFSGRTMRLLNPLQSLPLLQRHFGPQTPQ